jgi:hypothetical protein
MVSSKFNDLVLIHFLSRAQPFIVMRIFPAISLPACLAGKILSLPAHRERADKYLITWIYLRRISTISSPDRIFSRIFPCGRENAVILAALRPPYELLPEFWGFGLERPGCAD